MHTHTGAKIRNINNYVTLIMVSTITKIIVEDMQKGNVFFTTVWKHIYLESMNHTDIQNTNVNNVK